MHRAARRRLLGTGARRPTVAFSGLFGPRGLASIVFAVLLVEDADLSGEATATNAVYVTIGLSVLLHGLTASPLAARYGRWYAAHPRDAVPGFESTPAPEHPVRGHWTARRRHEHGDPGAESGNPTP